MVPEAPARAGGRATESLNAKLHGHYQYYGRPTNYRSLQQFYRSVRRIWKQGLSRRTRGRMADVEPLHGNPTAASVVATPDHALLENGEYCLRNPLREICTVGSVRGETSVGHGGPKRARSRKRWKEAKGSLQPTKSPLLGGPWRATLAVVRRERGQKCDEVLRFCSSRITAVWPAASAYISWGSSRAPGTFNVYR